MNANLTCRVDEPQDASIDENDADLDEDKEVAQPLCEIGGGRRLWESSIQILQGQSIGILKNIFKTHVMSC